MHKRLPVSQDPRANIQQERSVLDKGESPCSTCGGNLLYFSGMGMFDTIHFEKLIPCPGCGTEISSLQTKEFENLMADYSVGNVLRGGSVLKGIVKEELWCEPCSHAKRESRHPIYLVVWNTILAGVETTEEDAEKRLASVDRLDLVGWLDEAQRSTSVWKRRFYGLLGDMEKWQEHLEHQNKPPEDEKVARFRAIFKLSDEILNAEDPLKTLLTQHRDDAKQDKTPSGWW